MQPSMFNVRVPLEGGEVFLMNTFTDAQLIVSHDVADLLDGLKAGRLPSTLTDDQRDALNALSENGFIVESRDADRQNVSDFFHRVHENQDQLRLTVLTTLQCNFACGYCFQGDHGDYNKHAAKMSLETAERVARWAEERLDTLRPESFALTFFGGEPLLNLPVMYFLAERLWKSCDARGVRMLVNIITNGLLLTPDVVDRMAPYGLNGVKITLDGDRDMHNKMRPLRGGQGTFDKIVNNIRRVAGKCRISIGGNFDEESVDTYPALLDFLREQEFADKLTRVAFKPVIRTHLSTGGDACNPPRHPSAAAAPGVPPNSSLAGTPTPRSALRVTDAVTQSAGNKFIALTAVGSETKPLNGTCMTSAGGGTSICDNCNFIDEKMSFLREETIKRGFATVDGVHMGPCEIHRKHAHTIGPDGAIYACPGFTGDPKMSTGHIDGRQESWQQTAAARFDALAAWKQCNDCAFIPVCAGGCSVAAHTELGDLNAPNCHKTSFEAGLVTLARQAAASAHATVN